MNEQPSVIILAGPNGAGKSTCAPALLSEELQISEFVNADVIARGLSAFNSESVALQAGRIMLKRLKELSEQRVNFAFETTLSTRSFAPWLRKLTQTGYQFHLFYFWLESEELAVQRVEDRTRSGGHHIPKDVVRRRYHRSLINFFERYQSLTTEWSMYNNSNEDGPNLIAEGKGSTVANTPSLSLWNSIFGQYNDAN